MSQAFLGRQPIFDANLDIYGYELLFRQAGTYQADIQDGDQATSQVVVNAFIEMGLDKVVGNHLAFINFTRKFLLEDHPLLFPKDRVVMEIPENEVVDEDLIQAVKRLSENGYRIALDDYGFEPRWAPLIPAVDLIKLEVPALNALDQSEVRAQVRALHAQGKKTLAEKVENSEEFKTYKEMGVDYFQGYFLCRPKLISHTRLSTNRLAALRLLGALQQPDLGVDEIEVLIREDVSLSFKLLRYINSAFFALAQEISSVREAIVYLGMGQVKHWATALVMAGMSEQPQELMRLALVRGEMCQLLCEKEESGNPESYFLVGLFSLLDAIVGMPLPEVLHQLPLTNEVMAATINHEGMMGEALKCSIAYERCEWWDVKFGTLNHSDLAGIYLEAVQWSWAMNELITA